MHANSRWVRRQLIRHMQVKSSQVEFYFLQPNIRNLPQQVLHYVQHKHFVLSTNVITPIIYYIIQSTLIKSY